MKLSLDALRTLEAIAEYGSFAGAANALHRVPSALTYTIQKLEADLGDLEELYRRTVLPERGPSAAHTWLAGNLIRSTPAYLWGRATEGWRRLLGRIFGL